ncbi:hypothetical protein D1007_26229 [Hordeum vulgare]|nr:hypothetical protein D1007_26229 [Hordeum vulgare]
MAKWAKYREYRRLHAHHAAVYFTTRTLGPLEEEQEMMALNVKEEDAVVMVVRALQPGHRSMPIELNSSKEEQMMVQVEEKNKAKVTHHSNRLQGCRG